MSDNDWLAVEQELDKIGVEIVDVLPIDCICWIDGYPRGRHHQPECDWYNEGKDKVRAEYQRFYDFVGDADPALVDAWHFTENNKPGGLAEQVRNALGKQEQHAGDDNS